MLQLERISKSYATLAGPVPVLVEVNLSVGRGEVSALTGTSGSGKTTLMNIIGLLDRPDAGRIKIAGVETSRLAEDAAAAIRNQRIGFVFQSFHLLLRLSALDNVALPLLYRGIGRKERRRRAETALAQVGLSTRVDHRPDELSGGQRQRVAVARALVGGPSLLLADEPTGNLDSQTADEVMELFLSLNQSSGLTILIVTHDPTIAARCPRRIVMRDGRILDDNRNEPRSVGSLQ